MKPHWIYAIALTALSMLVLSANAQSFSSSLKDTENGVNLSIAKSLAAGCSSTILTADIQGGDTLATCKGDSVILSAYDSLAFAYEWNTGETTSQIVVYNTGSYSVVVFDSSGCSDTTSVYVYIGLSNINVDTLLPDQHTFCQGDSVLLDVFHNNIYAYEWNTGETNSQIWVTTAGQYSVVVYDSTSCTDTAWTSVSERFIDFDFGADKTYCQGDSLILDASGNYSSWLWNDSTTAPSLTVSFPGSYWVEITDSAGCSKRDTVNVMESPNPVVSIPNDTSVCQGNTVTITAPQGYASYLWSDGNTSAANQIGNAGSYTVTVTDSAGCSGTSNQLNVQVFTINVNIITDTAFCQGGQVTVSAPGGYNSYLWSDSSTQSYISIASAGTYYVTVTDSMGCQGTSNTVEVAVNIPVTPTITQNGDSLIANSLNTAVFWQWYQEGNQIPGANSQAYLVTAEGNYAVEIMDTNGCMAMSAAFFAETGIDFIPEGFSPNGDGVNDFFPIPNAGNLPGNELKVFNRWGSLVYNKKGYNDEWNGKGNSGSDLADGTYFYIFNPGDGSSPVQGFVVINR